MPLRTTALKDWGLKVRGLAFRALRFIVSLSSRTWLLVYYNKIPIYTTFYLLKGDYRDWKWLLQISGCKPWVWVLADDRHVAPLPTAWTAPP